LTKEGLDSHLKRLNTDVIKRNQKAKTEWLRQQAAKESGTATPAEKAAATADRATGKPANVPDHKLEEVQVKEEEAARERVLKEGKPVTEESIQKAKEAIRKEGRFRPYLIGYEDVQQGPFYRPEWLSTEQKKVWINKAHPFYETLYLSVVDAGVDRAKHAVDALLICLAKAELTAEKELQFIYEIQREKVWSEDIETIMRALLAQEADEEPDEELE
jgi:hypothetical protein